MTTLRIFGTVTSPYVRRCRIVAHELGLAVDLVDTAPDPGQAALREVTPIWKIPAAEIDGEPVFDSAVICEELLRRFGPGELAPTSSVDLRARNIVTVIDGALDALINVFYLRRDGHKDTAGSYIEKQGQRAQSAMRWLDENISGAWLTSTHRFGLPEIALCTAIDWMRFRDTYPVDDHGAIVRCAREHAERASLAATDPRAATSLW